MPASFFGKCVTRFVLGMCATMDFSHRRVSPNSIILLQISPVALLLHKDWHFFCDLDVVTNNPKLTGYESEKTANNSIDLRFTRIPVKPSNLHLHHVSVLSRFLLRL